SARLLRAEMKVWAGRRHLAAADAAGSAAPAKGAHRAEAEAAFRRALDELTHVHGGQDPGEVTVLAAKCLVHLGERRLAANPPTELVRPHPHPPPPHPRP